MKLIVAVNNKNIIGKNGELMWRCKEDLKNFKKLTQGGILIVGATTYEKCLKKKELPGRKMFVVGSAYMSLPAAVEAAYRELFLHPYQGTTLRHIWVIGGATIYEQLLPLVNEIHLSVIDDNQFGDVMFLIPPFYRGKVITYSFKPEINWIVGEDMICPATKRFCDECYPVGATCNLGPDNGLISACP